MGKKRLYDIVLFGATGFTGALTAEYLAGHHGKLRWALAGRNQQKLEAVRERLAAIDPGCAKLPLLIADVDDSDSLRRVAEAARVVITTVGPYIRYGEPLVAACAAAGTDYVDLTGEPEFVDRMWLGYHEQAKSTGARIVHCCGFDSIPHDLGAYFTVQQLPEEVPLRVEGYVRAGGQFSGGTLHSAVTAFSRLRQGAQASASRRAKDPYPYDRRIGSLRPKLRFHEQLGTWVLPMPTIDPQIVRRSAAGLERYGPDFRYGHYLQMKDLQGVAKLLGGVSVAMLAAQLPYTRKKLLALRQPGDGPSEEQRARGWFRVTFIGRGGGRRVRCEVTGGDPGYGETSKMLAESALCLAFDKLPKAAGVITPAIAMGDALIARLQQRGIQFRVVDSNE
ncbi:MAG TPA: saccharopine dehydrogenase NADP-binding domain-containing protein [Solimonas sp.]|nr:saccharopine dehydrogenase NADP-binding domain-containing protein [Solimonas sp.]